MGVAHRDLDPSRLREVFNAQRAASGLTFEQLAEASGVSRQTLLRLSAGQARGEVVTWMRLSIAFQVSMDELLGPVFIDEVHPGISSGGASDAG